MRRSPWRLVAPILLALAATSCTTPDDSGTLSNDGEEGTAYGAYVGGKADGFGGPDQPIRFAAACEAGDRLVIAAVGDVLLHTGLQKQGLADPDGFSSLWADAQDLLAAADVTYANLEGPVAPGVDRYGRDVKDPGPHFDKVVYSSYPQFNYYHTLVDDLKRSGVDIVSTANNHALDRRALGADRTIDELHRAGLAFTGTRKQDDTTSPWYAITRNAGFTLAWLACTFSTNGIPDKYGQVLRCYRDADTIEDLVRKLARRDDIDAVIVTPHWGQEYHAMPDTKQRKLAHRLLDAGATAILGSHPHVLQPYEKYTTADKREAFIVYSLGNFVSGQNHLPRRSTMLLYLGLTRRANGQVVVNGARYVPLNMSRTYPKGITHYEIKVIDRHGGPGNSRALTVDMFGLWNLHRPWNPPIPNAQCDAGWQAPHPHDGWIGGACTSDLACGDMTCAIDLPGGLCSTPCSGICPDQAGRATTFCTDLGIGGEGSCVLRCASDHDCRPGYVCTATPRFGQPSVIVDTCQPATKN